MRALTLLVLVAVASMLVVGCGPKKEELPPLEPAAAEAPAPVAVPGAGAGKTPVAVETMPPPPVARPRPLTPVKVPAETTPPAPADAAAGQSYVMKAGDTLYTLAKRFYGNGNLWTRIFDANKDKIKDPSHIPIGTTLTIPPK